MIRYIFDKNARKIIEVSMTNSYTVSSNGDYVYIDDDGKPLPEVKEGDVIPTLTNTEMLDMIPKIIGQYYFNIERELADEMIKQLKKL